MKNSRLAVLVALTAMAAYLWSCQIQAGMIVNAADTVLPTINGALDAVSIGAAPSETCTGVSLFAGESSCKNGKIDVMDATTLRYLTKPPATIRVQMPGQPGNVIIEPYGPFFDGAKANH